jgi:hypothetical protein
MATVKRIAERCTAAHALDATSAVDEAAGTIGGLVICGFESANNRRYPEPVLRRDHAKYEGAKAYLNHSRDGRVFQEWIGVVRNVGPGADGRPRGTLVLFKSDPWTAKVLEAAQKAPDKFGMSHVALCKTRYEGGTEVVESIEQVESVDVVIDPATTTGGLFESKGGRAVGLTPKQFAEAVARHPKTTTRQVTAAKRLAEDMGEMGLGDAPVMDEPSADADDTDGAITAAFESGIMAIVRSALAKGMDKKTVLKKVGKLLDGHADATSEVGGSDADAGAAADEPAAESRKNLPDPAAVYEELRRAKIEAGPMQFRLLLNTPDPAERAKFIQECVEARAGDGERPRSAGRSQFGGFTEEREAATRAQESRGGGPAKKDEPIRWED